MKTSWIVIGLVGFVTVLVLKTVGDAGEFRSIVEYGNEDCYRIEGRLHRDCVRATDRAFACNKARGARCWRP